MTFSKAETAFIYVLQNSCSQKSCKIHGKTPVLEPLLDKVAGETVCNFIKKTPVQLFYYEFCKIFKNTLFTEHLQTSVFLKRFADINQN